MPSCWHGRKAAYPYEYKVLKVSAGYTIKTLPTYEAAKAYAEKCCKANNNRDFTVCAWNGGMLIEL